MHHLQKAPIQNAKKHNDDAHVRNELPLQDKYDVDCEWCLHGEQINAQILSLLIQKSTKRKDILLRQYEILFSPIQEQMYHIYWVRMLLTKCKK